MPFFVVMTGGSLNNRRWWACNEGGRFCHWVVTKSHPSPQPSPHGGEGEREPIFMFFKPEFDSEFQVDVDQIAHTVSSLYPLGRGLG
jgi:hypothetical protein